MATYSDKLKDPRWQKKRLSILERDCWACCGCGANETTLNVHHLLYFKNTDLWDYEDRFLLTLCEPCHLFETNKDDLYKIFLSHFKRNFTSIIDLDFIIQNVFNTKL